MSYLLFYGAQDQAPRKEVLENLLCPYNLPLKCQKLDSKIFLYHNDFSEFKENQFLSPRNHQFEQNSAWSTLKITHGSIEIFTDPLRQCPLWCAQGEGWTAISPELKAFRSLQNFYLNIESAEELLKVRTRETNESEFKNVFRVDSHLAVLDTKSGKFQMLQSELPWKRKIFSFIEDESAAMEKLKNALCRSVNEVPQFDVASFLSGGVDSGVATSLTSKHSNVVCYNLCTSLGGESQESFQTSDWLKIQNKKILLDDGQLRETLRTLVRKNELTDGLTAEILLQLDVMLDFIPEKNIITGYGSDLLFGSMLSHGAYMAATGVKDSASLLNRTIWSKEFSPFYYWSKGKRFFHIFWHPDVIHAALQMTQSLNEYEGYDKFILRKMALTEGLLPAEIAFRKKQGMTNGTQMHLILSEHLGLERDYCYSEKSLLVVTEFKDIFA